MIAVFVLRVKAAKNRSQANMHNRPVSNLIDIGDSVEATIKQRDPEFVKDQFLSNVENLYVKIQYAWTERNADKMRPFETDALFNKHKTQLEYYKRAVELVFEKDNKKPFVKTLLYSVPLAKTVEL